MPLMSTEGAESTDNPNFDVAWTGSGPRVRTQSESPYFRCAAGRIEPRIARKLLARSLPIHAKRTSHDDKLTTRIMDMTAKWSEVSKLH